MSEIQRVPGSFPAFRIMTNGKLSASAIGGPKRNPLASKPAMCVGPSFPCALYRCTKKSTTMRNTAGFSKIPETS